VVFLDIKGAFDNVNYMKLKSAPHKHRIDLNIIKCIMSLNFIGGGSKGAKAPLGVLRGLAALTG
jgi:hypothetical protein